MDKCHSVVVDIIVNDFNKNHTILTFNGTLTFSEFKNNWFLFLPES